MADPFELWRMVWSSAVAQGVERFVDSFVPSTALAHPRPAELDLSAFATVGRVRIELSTMLLLEQPEPAPSKTSPVLIVAPYAVHDASIADFAEGHSIAMALAEGGPHRLALTFWKSATAEMRDFGIDAYLADLNVAVDDLGGRTSLIGLCQGGWLAAAYAARFPKKVAKLVLAGAPIDPGAAESGITQALASVPPATIQQIVALGGGRISGSLSFALWSDGLSPEFTAEAALQCCVDPAIMAKFNVWNLRTVDLPGAYFVQTVEWVFRENRLARGSFPALGRPAPLSAVEAPIFVLAAADDEVVSLPQATAAKSLCRRTRVKTRIAPGRHLSLFMGQRTVGGVWRDIAQWLAEPERELAPAPGAKRSRKRG
jgi:poly(3-hydroxyalkanoate) synthetase